MRKVCCCLSAALALACPACGKNLYPVAGKVTFNGSPAAGAVVCFVRQGANSGDEPALMSIVQNDGTFELVCGSQGKGAPPGDYDVLIEWTSVNRQGRRRHDPDLLRGRYADRKSPLLHAKVEAKTNQLPPFALTD